MIHSSENPDDGSATAPSLFLRAGVIRRMPPTVDHEWMTRPSNRQLSIAAAEDLYRLISTPYEKAEQIP
ncbi:MAG: hypothetical protein HC827_07390 [Cyanobacteria bacterium RM1_2_2]|nr:hypothetical protein [Cyanobacteria bacterium RM1_2_2]